MYLCIELFLTLCIFVYFCAFVCVVVNVLSMRSKATLLAGAVCTNIGCGGGLRGSQREVARHGPTPVQAHTYTHTNTQLLEQEAPNHTPHREKREHTQAQAHKRKGLLLLL